jgi:hypothetical protein
VEPDPNGDPGTDGGRNYDNRVVNPGDPGPYHNFPTSFDEQIINDGGVTVTNDNPEYTQYELPGSLNGTDGNYEVGLDGDGNVVHRCFRKL